MVKIIRDIKEMAEDESLCEYCDAEPGWHSNGCGEPYSCEGSWCKEAYERYLEDIGVTDTVVKIAKKTKVTIERGN